MLAVNNHLYHQNAAPTSHKEKKEEIDFSQELAIRLMYSQVNNTISPFYISRAHLDWNEAEEEKDAHQWDDNWDDDDVEDDFSQQLRFVY